MSNDSKEAHFSLEIVSYVYLHGRGLRYSEIDKQNYCRTIAPQENLSMMPSISILGQLRCLQPVFQRLQLCQLWPGLNSSAVDLENGDATKALFQLHNYGHNQ